MTIVLKQRRNKTSAAAVCLLACLLSSDIIALVEGFLPSGARKLSRGSLSQTKFVFDGRISEVLGSVSLATKPTSSKEAYLPLRATSMGEPPLSDFAIANDVESVDKSNREKKSWNDDGFVFGLDESGLARPKGRTSQVVVEGDSLETQPYQVAIVLGTFLAHALFAAFSMSAMTIANGGDIAGTLVQAIVLILTSWIMADFGSGVLHWSVDNYGNGRTPIMGGIIAAFQGHHAAPWTIAERGFCNNVYKLCIPFGVVPMMIINAIATPSITFFMTTFCVFEILSQEFHKWSHQRPSETPGWVNWLQKEGLTIGRAPHAQHHIAPYDGNYCIISGICNEPLDQTGFFRRLEHSIYWLNGVEPNAWKLDPDLRKRTLDGEYGLPRQP